MFRKLLFLLAILFYINNYGQDFVSIWNTAERGTSGDNEITIPTNPGFTYNYTVDWGDGTSDTAITGDITHTYAVAGSYTVSISGNFPAIYFNNGGDREKIIEILGWGTIAWESMEDAFHGCSNLNFDSIDNPDLSRVSSMKNMFRGCSSFNGIINNWNVETITNLSGTFSNCVVFNRPLDLWDTAAVVDMSFTFNNASIFNEPLDNWNVANVTTMESMFNQARGFNQNIDNWNVANATNMNSMFSGTSRFNQPLNSWNVANVIDMGNMFSSSVFNQPLNNWDVSKVTNMRLMFASNRDFNQDINNWTVDAVTDMSSMFLRARGFNQPLNLWNVGNVTNMARMFDGFFIVMAFNQNLNDWNVSGVTDMQNMFRDCRWFNHPLDNWDVGNVTNMAGMFDSAEAFNQDISGWNVSSVTNMANMFNNTLAFNQPLNIWDVSSVTNMSFIFAQSVFNSSLDMWDVSQVTNFSSAFSQNSVFNQDITGWNTQMADNLSGMFQGAIAFDQNLASWNVENVLRAFEMLNNSGLSQENYDNLLIGWAAQNVGDNLNLGALNLTYCDGRNARDELIADHNWSFTGDSVNCSFVLCTTITSPTDTDTMVPANSDIRWDPAPNATGYRITLEVERGGIRDFVVFGGNVADNLDVGNVVGLNFTNEFMPGDIVYITVVPYNADGPATGCPETSFTVIESWVNSPDAFKLTYDTNLQNGTFTTPINQLLIQTRQGFTYDFSIDWGDGQFNNNVSGDITHTYLTPGIYTVSIIGDFPAPRHDEFNSDSFKLLSIDQWGTYPWQTMSGAFAGCENMVYNASDIPDLTNVTDMNRMFIVCRNFNGSINNWDVSNVTNMRGMFGVASVFNQPLESWDVSNVTNMEFMFARAAEFNQNINSWDTGNVINMSRMFETAQAFNQPLNNWNVSNVTNMSRMFFGAAAFDQPLGNWVVGNVESMEQMFNTANNFNQNIDSWEVGSVRTMEGMFQSALVFDQPLNSWNVSNVETMKSMFSGAAAFNRPLGNWMVGNVESMEQMFIGARAFNQNINNWDVTNVITMKAMFARAVMYNQPMDNWDVNSVVDMSSMFSSAENFNQPLNSWDVSAVANMSFMFASATVFDQPLDNWDVSSVTLMQKMFQSASAFNQNINNWNVGVVTNMESMFEEAINFNEPLGNWDTGEVLNMAQMFRGASNFDRNIDAWNVSFVTNMEEMFQNATAYNHPMNSWNVASVTTMEGMFQGATTFNNLIDSWNVRRVSTMRNMFNGATAFNQSLNSWRVSNVGDMEFMFANASSYNQPMDQWNIGTLSMRSMFFNALAFDQYLGDWQIQNVTNMQDMLDLSGLIRENYDNTLIAWSEQNLTPGITLGAQNLPYCDALEERQSIIDNFGWNIQQDVLDCPVPECTQLTSPLNNATDVPVNTNLNWEATTFARGYRLEITVQPGNMIINETVIDATFYDFPADFTGGEQVFVRIIPFNDTGDAMGPCTEESFTISSAPATVPDCTLLTAPLNGSTGIAVDTDLSWETVVNADGYRLTVGSTSGGNDILDNVDVGNPNTFDLPMNLPENMEIFVTITPYNAEGGAMACVEERFTTQFVPTPPACTSLILPVNGATNVATNTQLSWTAVPDATGYLVTVGITSGGIEVANSIDVGNTTTYTFPMDLQGDRNHFVTIIPYNGVGDAIACMEESFRTGMGAVNTPPACTTLATPLNGATDVAIDLPEISWSAAANATQYRITVDGSTSNANDVTDLIVAGTSHPFANDFDNGETVTVTIVPVNANGDATGCTSESFTIVSASPVPPDCTTLVSPMDGATDVAMDLPEISWSAAANATQYRITVDGSTSNANDVTDLIVAGTSHPFANDFDNGETVTVTIVPVNANGDATGCTSESFTIVSASPVPPDCTTLVSPMDGATDIAVNLAQLGWNEVADADDYLLHVNGSLSDTNDVTGLIVTGTSYPFTNLFVNGETVTVTIIPRIGGVEAMNCSEERFTIIEDGTTMIPACSNLSMPLNLDIDVPIDTDISWDPVPNATGYRIRVGTEAGNGNLFNQDVGDTTTLNLPDDLPANSEIFVFIQPYNGSIDAESCEEERFLTATVGNLPICTALWFPEQDRRDIALNTELTWGAIGGVDGYLISIGTDTGGNDILGPLDVGLTTSFQPAEDLPPGTELFVTVTPYNAAGNAVGCESISFTTVGETTATSTTLFGFSPDGDGNNDFWTINGIEEYPNNTVTIYNRWGDTVFKISGYDNATNVFRGEANQLNGLGAGTLPEGTYFFTISLPENHNLNATKGYVVLKR